MDHLAQDLSVALEESESCGPATMEVTKVWGWATRRRTRSTGNLHLCFDKYIDDRSDDSSSGELDNRAIGILPKEFITNVRHSDSDDMSLNSVPSTYGTNKSSNKYSHIRNHFPSILRHNARPSIRRKRKLKRMCVDEVPVLPCGKRKRPQRIEPMITSLSNGSCPTIRPLNQSIVDKIEKIRMESQCLNTASSLSTSPMESSFLNPNTCGDAASESSISWSGDEGHEGDDELTDWTPQPDPVPTTGEFWSLDNSTDSREIRAGCRRLYNERPGFSITSGVNERIARFMQDGGRTELRLFEGERDALTQLAALYSLECWEEGSSVVLKKTGRTPCMQPPQRHHTGLSTGHKRIRTHETRPL